MPRVMKTRRVERFATRPLDEFDGRMENMLHALNDQRTMPAFYVDEALHAQQIGSTHCGQHLHTLRECRPRKRFIVAQRECADIAS